MKILISGASGLVGSALALRFRKEGHDVGRLVREVHKSRPGDIPWSPLEGHLDPAAFEGIDAVVHLAGENIAGGRWTGPRKTAILESRVRGTWLVAETIARIPNPPRVLVSASAIGFYGDRGSRELGEDEAPGQGFLADLCGEWERAARPASDAGIRQVSLRIGIVLSTEGGALSRMLLPFKLGLGGRIGDGRQYMSWITLEDLVGAIAHCIHDGNLSGPVNAVAPNPVTNREFTRLLGRALRRPAIIPIPAVALRLAMGEMADELLLYSARVLPKKLLASGFQFRFPQLPEALAHVLRENP